MSGFNKFKRSSERFLRKVFHKPKAEISRGSILLVLALSIIFFAALGLRVFSLLDSQPIVRAFDPWFQLKVTEYVSDNGFAAFFTWYDDTTWVPYGRDIARTTYIGVPFTTAAFYTLLSGLGISVDIITVALVVPAVMGAMTVFVAFLLGREAYNNSVGLLSALFLAFMPAFLQRTIAGFYDNEFIGVFAITLSLYFFIRSIKRGSLPSAVAAGLSVAYLQVSWGASDFLTALFALYAFFMLISGKYNTRVLTAYLPTLAIGMFVGGLIPRNGFGDLTSFSTLAPIGVAGLLVFYEIWMRVQTQREATAVALAPYMRPLLAGIITPVIGVGAYMAYSSSNELSIATSNPNPFLTIGGKFLTVVNPFYRLDQRIFASVAEHLPSPWGSFYYTLLLLIFFFPLGMYFAFRRGRDEDWLLLLYGVVAVYFTGSMIRLSLVLAPGVAILAAIAVNGILQPFAKVVTENTVFERRRFRMSASLTSEHALAAFFFIGILLSVNVYMGAQYATQGVNQPEFALAPLSSPGQVTDWQTAMTYVRNVLPETAVIGSWWDYGYWINGAGGKDTIVDNATFNQTQIALMGYALMALNLTESLKTFSQWNTTHVLVYWGHRLNYFGGDEGKWPWMVRIAEDRLGTSVIDDATYLGDDPDTPQEETEAAQEAFYQSTLYKLLTYGEPVSAEQAQSMGLPDGRVSVDTADGSYLSDPDWTSHIPRSLYGAFKGPYYSSSYGIVKIYEIDYTMYYQYLNKTKADYTPLRGSLEDVNLDGNLSETEQSYDSFDVVFGGGYDATVYSQSNGTHMYYGIKMDNYTVGDDSIGFQFAPADSKTRTDLRIVDYAGEDYYDGYTDYTGDWNTDSTGSNPEEVAKSDGFIEYLIPLDSDESQDQNMEPGMNYQLRLLFWNNRNSGEPTYASNWGTIWIPVILY
ncbi:MAG: hypothetical protein GF411_06695 [Candidatus Lokiarchaeota archaeon]|nr:hypothetical protein [Candidatus Lokiarchaeota archaeon]